MSDVDAFERFKIKLIGTVSRKWERCFFFHDFGRWSSAKTENITRQNAVIGYLITQHRFCRKCHYAQVKSQQISVDQNSLLD